MGTALKRAHQVRGMNGPQLERTCHPQQIVPVLENERKVDFMACQRIQSAIIRLRVHMPETRPANVSQTRAELIAKQPKQAKDNVAVAGGIGHDFEGLEGSLLFEQAFQDIQRVTQSAWDNNAVKASELVAGEIEVGHALVA